MCGIRMSSHKGAQGFNVFVTLLQSTRFVLQSHVDVKWWVANVKNTKSIVPLICEVCNVRSMPSIGGFVQRRSASCGCVRCNWKTLDGFMNFQQIVSTLKCKLQAHVDADWWLGHVVSCQSKIPMVCRTCDATFVVMISCAKQGRSGACWCNGGLTYATEHGRQRILEILRFVSFQPIGALTSQSLWKAANVTAFDTIELKCDDCLHVATPTVFNFVNQRTALCKCSKRWPWSADDRRVETIETLDEMNCVAIGRLATLLNNPAAWSAAGLSSMTRVDVKCAACCVSWQQKINVLVNRRSKNCGCRNKTEELMAQLIESTLDPTRFYVARHLNVGPSAYNGHLYVDVAIRCVESDTIVGVFECDGVQHFRNSFHEDDDKWMRSRANDKDKEQLVIAMGCPVVRVFQPALWLPPRRLESSEFVKSMVCRAVNGELCAQVYTLPNTKEYQGW